MNVSGSTPFPPRMFPPIAGASTGLSAPGALPESASSQPALAEGAPEGSSVPPVEGSGSTRKSASDDRSEKSGNSDRAVFQLDEAELDELRILKARDREVRAHELAHQAVGGQYAGAVSYTFQRGPDGAQYAVGGQVSIDVAPVSGDPQATIQKMRIVRAAALAPAQPSGQDRAVAAQAMQLMLQAQTELASSARSRPDEAGGESLTRVSDGAMQADEVSRLYGRIAQEGDEQYPLPERTPGQFQAIA